MLCTIIVATITVAAALATTTTTTVTTTVTPPENRHFGLQLTSFSAVVDPQLAELNLTHKASSISFSVDIKQILNGPMKIVTLLQIRTRDTLFGRNVGSDGDAKAFRTFLNNSLEFCSFLSNPSLDPFMNLIHHQAVNMPGNHIFTKCPIEVDRYYVNDVNLDFKLFPGKMPSFLFKCRVTMFLVRPPNQRMVYDALATGQVGNRPAMGRRRTSRN